MLLLLTQALQGASSSMETTPALSKAGGMGGTATNQQTKSSGASTFSFDPFHVTLKSSLSMSLVRSTQPTHHQEESLAPFTSSSPQSTCPNPSTLSLSMLLPPFLLQNEQPLGKVENPHLLAKLPTQVAQLAQSSHPPPTKQPTQCPVSPPTPLDMPDRFNTPIAKALEARLASPLPYHPDLAPLPSPLRPHVLAKDRLCLWLPDPSSEPAPTGALSVVPQDRADRIRDVLNHSWHDSTKATYGAGLAIFHVFCDRQEVPEHLRCPAPPVLILSFIASCAGFYSGSTVANYSAGLKAWHTLHGRPWLVDSTTLKCCIEGAVKLAPPVLQAFASCPSNSRNHYPLSESPPPQRAFGCSNFRLSHDLFLVHCTSRGVYSSHHQGFFASQAHHQSKRLYRPRSSCAHSLEVRHSSHQVVSCHQQGRVRPVCKTRRSSRPFLRTREPPQHQPWSPLQPPLCLETR